jgi:hypothetical protein
VAVATAPLLAAAIAAAVVIQQRNLRITVLGQIEPYRLAPPPRAPAAPSSTSPWPTSPSPAANR